MTRAQYDWHGLCYWCGEVCPEGTSPGAGCSPGCAWGLAWEKGEQSSEEAFWRGYYEACRMLDSSVRMNSAQRDVIAGEAEKARERLKLDQPPSRGRSE